MSALSEIKSKSELSKFIESYWHFDASLQPELILFPDGTFNVVVATSTFQYDNQIFAPGIYLIPITTKPIHLICHGRIYGIRFKAFSFVNIVGKRKSLIKNINELESVGNVQLKANHVLPDFKVQSDLEEKKAGLENLAFDLLNNKYELNEDLRAQVNYILDRKGDVKISELCSFAGITRQGLHKSFQTQMGIGAKELAMTWKLNHFFTLLSEDQTLTASSLDAGFFDQAHCIHTFKQHWQISPGNFQRKNPQLVAYAKESMSKRFKNFYDPEI